MANPVTLQAPNHYFGCPSQHLWKETGIEIIVNITTHLRSLVPGDNNLQRWCQGSKKPDANGKQQSAAQAGHHW